MTSMLVDEIATLINHDIAALLAVEPLVLGEAQPSNDTGVYMLLINDEVVYVGKANGAKGLNDRFKKHISGDEGHAIQRAFAQLFPDRLARREHIKKTVYARWLPISGQHRVSAIERILIWMYEPPWNQD